MAAGPVVIAPGPTTLFTTLLALEGVAAAVLIERTRRWALVRLVDQPNARSSHTVPTPRGGGIGLVVAALGAWGVLLWAARALSWPPFAALLAGGTMVAVVSWIDDLRTIRFSARLLVHLLAAVLVLTFGAVPREAVIGDLGVVPLGPLGWPLALIWIAGLANAYNFMDGIDGIAGGQGLVAGLAWWGLGLYWLLPLVGALGAFLAVACAVFLRFNWAPARIFMGDVGSATLGFLFAALPFVFPEVMARAAWVPASAVVWPFVFDAGFTLVRRWRRGEKVTEAHRSHLYQRLVIAGWSHARVSLLYIGWAVTTSAAAWAMAHGWRGSGLGGLAWAVVSGFGVWRLTLGVEGRAAR